VQHQNPEYTVEPRWWVDTNKVVEAVGGERPAGFLAFKDITSPTNQRTMIAAAIPWTAVTNHLPLMLTEVDTRRSLCLLGNLNSVVFDYAARQKIGGITLNFFIVEQLAAFGPDFYEQRCPWEKKGTLEKWISERVLKLTCVSEDMKPLAEAAKFKPLVYKWDANERAELMAELDAAFFLLYGIEREDVEHILSTFNGIARESEGIFAGRTTRERILACYDRFREVVS